MYRVLLSFSLLLSCLLSTTAVFAQAPPQPSAFFLDDIYISSTLGYTLAASDAVDSSVDFRASDDDGFLLGTAIGTYLLPELRAELEYEYRKSTSEITWSSSQCHGSIVQQTLGVNGFFEPITNSYISPYIGAGVGVAIVWLEDASVLNTDGSYTSSTLKSGITVPVYRLMTGFSVMLSPHTELDAQYRYQVLDNFKASGSHTDDLEIDSRYQHSLMLSLRYTF
jgi:opacity protein-like surface antigen